MDITTFVLGGRDAALLLGDYNSYKTKLTRRLLAIRRRLGITTTKNVKFTKKDAITTANVAKSKEYVHLLLLSAERAWACAMHIKSMRSEDDTGKAVTGYAREHILARLNKAAKYGKEVVELLSDRSGTNSSDQDVLEVQAYHASLRGTLLFEKQVEGVKKNKDVSKNQEAWNLCLSELAVAHISYAALLHDSKKDIFKDILTNTIDPSIRYAAYQAKISRTVAVSTVAQQSFPSERSELSKLVLQIWPEAFEQKQVSSSQKEAEVSGTVPDSIKWRGRSAKIADATIGQALAQASIAQTTLEEYLSSNQTIPSSKKAAAYDNILIAYQDAVDANRKAIEEIEKEGVDEGDSRMQDLRISDLTLNYVLVSWRIGRNRVLIGQDDGMTLPEQIVKRSKRSRKDDVFRKDKPEARSRQLQQLRERVVLYDSTLQSMDNLKSVRGAMRDSTFVAELDAKRSYFQALKCLNIAHAHTLLKAPLNVLSLLSRASDLVAQATPPSQSSADNEPSSSTAPTLAISPAQIKLLQDHLHKITLHHHALAQLHVLEEEYATTQNAKFPKVNDQEDSLNELPLVFNLETYFPEPGVTVDLNNLVPYPAKLYPVPVKPIFFDVAWNYIDYPGRNTDLTNVADGGNDNSSKTSAGEVEVQEDQGRKKSKGWFGFGRS